MQSYSMHTFCLVIMAYSMWGHMARQGRPNDIDDSAHQFNADLPFLYAHLAGNCRRKVLLELFGENSCDMVFSEPLML